MEKYVKSMAGTKGVDPSETEINRRAQRIEDAIDAGILSYTRLAKAAKITVSNLQWVFRKRPEVHKKYRVALLAIQAYAESNLVEAIMDPKHPKNFEATKLFMGKYRIDMDSVFEKVADTPSDIEVNVIPNPDESKGTTVKINFTSQSKRSQEEE